MSLSTSSVFVGFTTYLFIIVLLLSTANGSTLSEKEKCPFPYVTNVEGNASCIKCEIGKVPSYDLSHCVGCLPHLYAFNGTCVKECPQGYWHREADRALAQHVYKGDENLYGKRCEPERIGVVESWGIE